MTKLSLICVNSWQFVSIRRPGTDFWSNSSILTPEWPFAGWGYGRGGQIGSEMTLWRVHLEVQKCPLERARNDRFTGTFSPKKVTPRGSSWVPTRRRGWFWCFWTRFGVQVTIWGHNWRFGPTFDQSWPILTNLSSNCWQFSVSERFWHRFEWNSREFLRRLWGGSFIHHKSTDLFFYLRKPKLKGLLFIINPPIYYFIRETRFKGDLFLFNYDLNSVKMSVVADRDR